MRRFADFRQINQEHDDLLSRLDELQEQERMSVEQAMTELWAPIRKFVASVSKAGQDLYIDQERSAAQSLLNYWSNALTRADLEHLPLSLLPFSEEMSAGDDLDFPFDLEGQNRRMTWDHYAAGRRLQTEALKAWELMHFIAIVGARGSGRGTALHEVILPAVQKQMEVENGVPPHVLHLPPQGAVLEPLFEEIRNLEAKADGGAGNAQADGQHPLERCAALQAPAARTLLVVHDLRAMLLQIDEEYWKDWLAALSNWVRVGNGLILVINHAHLRLLGEYPDFRQKVISQQVTTVYDSNELREFIEMPARAAGVYFEEGVVDRIVRNVQGQMGVLALLNFSLERLWDAFRERGGHKLIKRQDYDKVGSGRASVDRAAEEALASLPGDEDAVESIFLQLVGPTLEGWETCAVPYEQLRNCLKQPGRLDSILEAYVAAKILAVRELPAGQKEVSLRHFALAGFWARLQSWVEAARDKNLPHLLLPRVARRWSRNPSPDLLWSGDFLKAVEPCASKKNKTEQCFIKAAVRARRYRRISRTGGVVAAIVAVLVPLSIYLIANYRAASAAKKAAERETGLRKEAEETARELEKARAQLRTDRGERLLESQDPAGALFWFQDDKSDSASGDWRARRESIAANSLPELFRLALLKDETPGNAGADVATRIEATGWWMEYSRDGSHGLIAARNLGDKPGGMLLWNLNDAAPRAILRERSYERVKFFAPKAVDEEFVVALSAPKVGAETGRLELWKWADLLKARDHATPAAMVELNAFPLDLAIEGGASDLAPVKHGNLIAVGTGQGDNLDGSRVLLFEIKKKEGNVELLRRDDLNETFNGRANGPFVNAVQFSKDGRWLLSGAGDVNDERGEALLFSRKRDDTFRGEPRRLKHDAPVANVDFSPDLIHFVTATGTQQRGPGEARLWEIGQGAPEFANLTSIPLSHRARVVEARFSPDSRLLVTASQDGAARIWNVKDGSFISVLEHDGWLFGARWSPDGRYILTGSRDRFARLWDATTGLLAWPKLAHTAPVSLMQFAPDGSSVFTGTGREFRIWCWQSKQAQPIPTLPRGTVSDAAFSPDGRWLATGVKRTDRSELGEVVLVEAGTGKERARLIVGGPVNQVVFSADGRWLAAGGGRRSGRGGIIRIWEVAHPERERPAIVTEEPVVWLSFQEPSADRLVALLHNTAENWSRIAVFSTSDGKPFCPPFDPQPPPSVQHTSENAAKTASRRNMIADETINAVALSPNGKFLVVGGGNLTRKKTFLAVFDLSTAREDTAPTRVLIDPKTHGHIEAITALAFNHDTSLLISGSVDDWARIFDFAKLVANTPKDEALWKKGEYKQNADISKVGFSADGRRAFSCAYDGRVLVIDTVKPGVVPRALDHPGAVRSASFRHDGMLLATGGDDRNARLWNTETGELVGIFPHPWPIASVQLSSAIALSTGEQRRTEPPDEYLLTTAFYYTQHLATRGAQRSGPPFTTSFALGSRSPMRADTSEVNHRRVDARRWTVTASPSDTHAPLDSLSARGLGKDERVVALTFNDLTPFAERPFLSSSSEVHASTANLCEEQELWHAAQWHWERASLAGAPGAWQKIRMLSGAKEWEKVLSACNSAPAELRQDADFLRLKAEAQIAMARRGDKAALQNSLATLREWEALEPGDIIAPLRVSEVLFFLDEYEQADQELAKLLKREQSNVLSSTTAERGTLPSLWQRRAEHSLLAMKATGDRNLWLPRYHEAAIALLDNFRSSVDNGGVVAWPFALAPRSVWKDHPRLQADPESFWREIETIADQAVELDPQNFYRLNTLGALLVRSGRFREAVPWLEEARRIHSQTLSGRLPQETGRPLDWCFLTLAHNGLAAAPGLQLNSQERRHHEDRARGFAELLRKNQSTAPQGGNVWREELTRREIEFLNGEIESIFPK